MTTLTEQGWSQPSGSDDLISLVVQRCTECGQVVFPPTVERCSRCWSTDLAVEQSPATGSVYSYTVVRRSFPGRETPYIVGLVDLDGGLRVMATIAADESQVVVGARVAGYAGTERPGLPATAYEFRPVEVITALHRSEVRA